MPCNEIRTAAVSLELRADNQELLVAALKSLGYSVTITNGVVTFVGPGVRGRFVNGKLDVSGYEDRVQEFDVNKVKRAYSEQVVQHAAKKFNWTLNKKSATKFVVQKKGF